MREKQGGQSSSERSLECLVAERKNPGQGFCFTRQETVTLKRSLMCLINKNNVQLINLQKVASNSQHVGPDHQ